VLTNAKKLKRILRILTDTNKTVINTNKCTLIRILNILQHTNKYNRNVLAEY